MRHPAIAPPLRSSQATSRSEEHTSELQSQSNIVCRLLLEKKKHVAYPKQHGINRTSTDKRLSEPSNDYPSVLLKDIHQLNSLYQQPQQIPAHVDTDHLTHP